MMLRVVARDGLRSSRPLLFRCYSIPTQTTGERPLSTPPNPTPPAKKQKLLDLRPAPIKPIQKPQPISANNGAPIKAHRPTHNAVETSTKLSAAKEEVKHDIHDAEAHGILKPPPPDANWFKRTLHTAIQLLKFYYHGVKLIFTRRKEIAAIKARIAAGGSELTRAEFRLIQTQKDDIKKVVPFLIIALLLEEVIPLIAIYFPSMLPSTCILPSQRERIEAKRAEKAQAIAAEQRHLYAELRRAEEPAGYLPANALNLSGTPTAICGLLGLSTIGIDFLRIRRIRNHIDFITRDDQLLLQNDAVKSLSARELKEAVEERGMLTRGMVHKDLQARLSWWLQSVKDSNSDVDDVALSRRLALIISSR